MHILSKTSYTLLIHIIPKGASLYLFRSVLLNWPDKVRHQLPLQPQSRLQARRPRQTRRAERMGRIPPAQSGQVHASHVQHQGEDRKRMGGLFDNRERQVHVPGSQETDG